MQNKFETYAPAEDTFFLAEHVKNERGLAALEIGTGSGYLARILEEGFDIVVATDIDFESLRSQTQRPQNTICCDGAAALGAKFDLVVCNLPYLPSDGIVDRTVDGGPEGLVVPRRIIESASRCTKDGGRILYLTSSLANYQKLISYIESLGFLPTIRAKKKLFFEELILVEATKSQTPGR
ncbi:MAG: methyltransferase [Candidatus Nitrosotenuis sp.]